MKTRKIKTFVLFLATILLIGTASFYSKADDSTASVMSEWGARLKEYVDTDESLSKDIYASGKTGTVTREEINQAKEFYMISGMDEETAIAKAEEYMMEREALYQKAIQSGYGVSDQNIREYIEELKSLMEVAKNKEDVQALISQFDTEDEYWAYQYKVYEKNLPIQNYVKDLEKQFIDSNVKTYAMNGEDADYIEDQWNQYYERLKLEFVEAEEFEVLE